jgi:NadR type nicotinamide-nucleotide adenylyltransferase
VRARRRTSTPLSAFGPAQEPRQGRGLILGRFLPPHLGHQFLIDFARQYVADLTILLCSTPRDAIAGELRLGWLREMCPDGLVLHLPNTQPLADLKDEAARRHWVEMIRHYLATPDYLFASEAPARFLAEALGAKYVPVDPPRGSVPISGQAVRADPLANWHFLPPCVRPHFVRRVCLLGPESTGKSTLARQLAEQFATVAVGEYARTVREDRPGDLEAEDMQQVARGQLAAEEALARQANRVLICDTDLLSVWLWCERLFGLCPEWIRAEAGRRRPDLYLLTEADVPFVGPAAWDEPEQRQAFGRACRRLLRTQKRPYVRLRGSWDDRFRRARAAVRKLLRPPAPDQAIDQPPPQPEVEKDNGN